MHSSRTPIQLTIGDGKPGGKTLALRNDADVIGRVGFNFPDNIAFTPQFYHRFLADSGALGARTYREVQQRVYEHNFSSSERSLIREAVQSLPGRTNGIYVRSDDWPVGTGLWQSYLASAPPGNDGELVLRVEKALKFVLSSDFLPDVLAFKQKKGLTETVGVLLMPFFGYNIEIKGQTYRSPGVVITYIGKVNGRQFSFRSEGLSGLQIIETPFDTVLSKPFLDLSSGRKTNLDIPAELAHRGTLDSEVPETGKSVQQMLNELLNQTGPRYLEIIKDDSSPEWSIVQSAPFNIPAIERPEVPEDAKVASVKRLFGTGIVRGETIKYNALHIPNSYPGEFGKPIPAIQEIDAFNKQHKDYLLIIQTSTIPDFSGHIELGNFSNASAVLLVVDEMLRGAQGHLGGRFREFGIPILLALDDKVNGNWLRSLRRNTQQNQKFVVYANEFNSDGFIALE